MRIDPEDYEWASKHGWYLKSGYPCRYVPVTRRGAGDWTEYFLHREIMGHPEGSRKVHVHHIDGDILNCRRSNLVILSAREHYHAHDRTEVVKQCVYNAPARAASGYKGVCRHEKSQKWVVQFAVDGRNRTIYATSDSAEDAAVVYDAAVIAYRPKGSYTNLIEWEEE